MSRNRLRYDPSVPLSVGPTITYTYGHGPVVTGGASLCIGSSGSEQIIDDLAPSQLTKTVTHWKITHRKYEIDRWQGSHPSAAPSGLTVTGKNSYWSVWGDRGYVDNNIAITSYTKSPLALLRAAKKKFSMQNEVEGLLNAVESPQLIQSYKDAKAFLTPEKTSYYRKPYNYGRAAKDLSSLYLGYSFGIAPLIADIQKVNKALKTLQPSVQKYLKDYNSIVTATAQCGGTLAIGAYEYGGYNPSNTDVSTWRPRLVPKSIVRTVGVKGYRNGSQYSSDGFKKLDYYLSRFVSSGPASYSWERIPFSFVVDWFIDLSDVLGSLDNALTGFGKTYVDGWQSDKSDFEVEVLHNTAGLGDWVDADDGLLIAYNVMSQYHREYLDPNQISIGLSERFGKKQAGYLAALLYQTVANWKKL